MKVRMLAKTLITLIATAIAMPMVATAEEQGPELKIFGKIQLELVSFEEGEGDAVLVLTDGCERCPDQGNGSAIGATVTSPIDDGLSAFGKVNFNFQPDDGDYANGLAIKGRDMYVGVKSDTYGHILMGRAVSAYKSSTVKWDPFLTTFLQARGNGGATTAYNSYVSNLAEYGKVWDLDPAKIALKAQLMLDETRENDFGYSASVNVALSAIEVAAAYLSQDGDESTLSLAAKYAGKIAGQTVGLVVRAEDTDVRGYSVPGSDSVLDDDTGAVVTPAVPSRGMEGSFIHVNGSIKMGKVTPVIGVGQFSAADDDADATYIAVGVLVSVTKTTRFHIGYRQTNSDADAVDAKAFGVGMSLKF